MWSAPTLCTCCNNFTGFVVFDLKCVINVKLSSDEDPDQALCLTWLSVAAAPPASSLTPPSASEVWHVEEEGEQVGSGRRRRRAGQRAAGREAEEEVRGGGAPPGTSAPLDSLSPRTWRCWRIHLVHTQIDSETHTEPGGAVSTILYTVFLLVYMPWMHIDTCLLKHLSYFRGIS